MHTDSGSQLEASGLGSWLNCQSTGGGAGCRVHWCWVRWVRLVPWIWRVWRVKRFEKVALRRAPQFWGASGHLPTNMQSVQLWADRILIMEIHVPGPKCNKSHDHSCLSKLKCRRTCDKLASAVERAVADKRATERPRPTWYMDVYGTWS